MNLLDVLDMYAMLNDSDDLTLMLQDYTLDSRLDRGVMNITIIRELGAMRPFVNDTTVFKLSLENFFNKWNYNIGKLIDTMYYEYDPIGNKALHRTLNENSTDDRTLGETEHRESTADIDNTDKYSTNTDNTETGTQETQVSAYDISTYQPKERITHTTTNDTDTTHSGETTSDIKSDVDTSHNLTEGNENEHHLGENITGKDGDSSYQELIEQERRLAEFNIFEWIIKRMREELFLLVY